MENSLNVIEKEIENGKNLALYHLPGSNILFYLSKATCQHLHSIEELEGEKGFVAVPFSCDENHPILLLEGEQQTLPFPSQRIEQPKCGLLTSTQEEKISYFDHFRKFKTAIDTGSFQKLVLSRRSQRCRPTTFSPMVAFKKACIAYPNSFVYLFSTKESGIWLGSTPEILLSGKGHNWETVALAGTQPQPAIPSEIRWDEKNQIEQAHVSNFIREILKGATHEVHETGPYTISAGSLCHLKTHFDFQLGDPQKALFILKSLHPTPAVCGLPQQAAFQYIQENEGYVRGWYSGFIGPLDLNTETHLYVNLRCMEIQKNTIQLYAGGGLVAGSEMEKEWIETENKMGTIGSLLL